MRGASPKITLKRAKSFKEKRLIQAALLSGASVTNLVKDDNFGIEVGDNKFANPFFGASLPRDAFPAHPLSSTKAFHELGYSKHPTNVETVKPGVLSPWAKNKIRRFDEEFAESPEPRFDIEKEGKRWLESARKIPSAPRKQDWLIRQNSSQCLLSADELGGTIAKRVETSPVRYAATLTSKTKRFQASEPVTLAGPGAHDSWTHQRPKIPPRLAPVPPFASTAGRFPAQRRPITSDVDYLSELASKNDHSWSGGVASFASKPGRDPGLRILPLLRPSTSLKLRPLYSKASNGPREPVSRSQQELQAVMDRKKEKAKAKASSIAATVDKNQNWLEEMLEEEQSKGGQSEKAKALLRQHTVASSDQGGDQAKSLKKAPRRINTTPGLLTSKPTQSGLRVHVVTYSGVAMTFFVKAGETLAGLKQIIAKRRQVPPGKQVLFFEDVELDGVGSLKSCGIRQDSVMRLWER